MQKIKFSTKSGKNQTTKEAIAHDDLKNNHKQNERYRIHRD